MELYRSAYGEKTIRIITPSIIAPTPFVINGRMLMVYCGTEVCAGWYKYKKNGA